MDRKKWLRYVCLPLAVAGLGHLNWLLDFPSGPGSIVLYGNNDSCVNFSLILPPPPCYGYLQITDNDSRKKVDREIARYEAQISIVVEVLAVRQKSSLLISGQPVKKLALNR